MNYTYEAKISDLIKRLEEIKNKHGDLFVGIDGSRNYLEIFTLDDIAKIKPGTDSIFEKDLKELGLDEKFVLLL